MEELHYGTSERQPDHRCLCYGCKNCDRNSSCADLQCNPSIYRQQKKRFMFKKQLSLFWVITMYVNGGLIPTFLLYKGLGLNNSFWVYVIPGMVSAFNMLVIRTYMNGIPDSLEESAQLDGAGYTTIFLKIYSPLCKPVYATVALFVAVGQWNSWFDAMLYNRMNGKLTTLQYELMKLLSSVTNTSSSVGQ